MRPEVGQRWEDRGTVVTVESVAEDGGAVVRLESGERLPVRPSFFSRARIVAREQGDGEARG